MSDDTDKESSSRIHALAAPAVLAVLVCVLSLLPHLVGVFGAHGRYFPGATTNVPDYSVYLTWIALASHGQFIDHHLFTNVGSAGELINPAYLVIGWLAAALHLSLPVAYQTGRGLFDIGFVFAAWWLIGLVFENSHIRTRILCLTLICFSSGIGWMIPWHGDGGPIDTWQPEAITFLSLYSYPHFAASLLLLVLIYGCFIKAQRERSWAWAVFCGLAGYLLALVHTYDVVTVGLVGVVYIAIRLIVARYQNLESRKGEPSVDFAAASLIIAAVLAALGFAYETYQYTHDPLLASQDLPVKTAGFLSVAAGYGLVGLFAALCALLVARKAEGFSLDTYISDRSVYILIVSWALATLIAVYLPFHFQRKLIEGLHIPLCILAAVGIDYCFIHARRKEPRGKPLSFAEIGTVGLVLSIGCWVYLWHDIQRVEQNDLYHYRAYLAPGEVDALNWGSTHTPPNTIIQALPWVGLNQNGSLYASDETLQSYVPAFTLHHEHAGHWSLTPKFPQREYNLLVANSPSTNSTERIARLEAAGIDYVIFSQKANPDTTADQVFGEFRGKSSLPSYYKLVYSNSDADIYQIMVLHSSDSAR